MWINQTIRNTNALTANRPGGNLQVASGGFAKVKYFKQMWLEVNNQGFEISKLGNLYTVSFSLYRGRKGRIPLSIHQASHTNVLEKVIQGSAKLGSLKLCKSKKGIWYALISVSMEVPDTGEVKGWIGVDRGQNNIAVAALPKGFGKFWLMWASESIETAVSTRSSPTPTSQTALLRRHKTNLRLPQVGGDEVKRLEQRERRIMTHINHVISKELVQFALDFGMGLRFEDLSGCRSSMKQKKKTKSDAAQNRDTWAFYQLEAFTRYKAIRMGVPVESVPAPYTSKSDHRNGVLGVRNGDWFRGYDGYRCNADYNASQNIGQWLGFSCPLDLQKAVAVMATADAEGERYDTALTSVASKTAALAQS